MDGSIVRRHWSRRSSLLPPPCTYSINANGGAYGQFIPGVTPAEGIRVGDKPLQILQLEQSQNFRTNLGLAELTGKAARASVSFLIPDSRVIPTVRVRPRPLRVPPDRSDHGRPQPRPAHLQRTNLSPVTIGAERITTYRSVIDNVTQDPTYVPTQ